MIKTCGGLLAVSLTVTMLRCLPCWLLLSVVLTQRSLSLSPGRDPLMSGRFLYRAQPGDEEMWSNYFNLLHIPLTEVNTGHRSSKVPT